LEQHLNHVLRPLINGALMQNRPKPFKHSRIRLGRLFGEKGADMTHESHGYFNRVVRWILKEKGEDLQG